MPYDRAPCGNKEYSILFYSILFYQTQTHGTNVMDKKSAI